MLLAVCIFLSLVIGFFVGYHLQSLQTALKEVSSLLKQKRDNPKDDVKKSSIVDPLDPEQEARRDFISRQRDLNPDE